jgi:anion-transporting  ArsA/GET3 family ATPase
LHSQPSCFDRILPGPLPAAARWGAPAGVNLPVRAVNPTPDNRPLAALEAALGVIAETVRQTCEQFAGFLQPQSRAGSERIDLQAAQNDLKRGMLLFQHGFRAALKEQVKQTLAAAPTTTSSGRSATGSWETLTLLEDDQVEQKMELDRLARVLGDASDWEVREVAAYMAAVVRNPRGDADSNPVRPSVIAAALSKAAEGVSPPGNARLALTRELGALLAPALRDTYRHILADLQARGFQPSGLTVRTTEGPGGTNMTGYVSGYQTLSGLEASRPMDAARGGRGDASSTRSGGEALAADRQLMQLLRRLTSLASRPGAFDPQPGGVTGYRPSSFATSQHGGGAQVVNLIRAHRDELMQASPGRLDHLVIDVVGSLFDQVLSDPRVPPAMARQIARLQLPVLRVAMNDPTFFSSRKHPVRRFVNRIASLALAYDDFDEGIGREFLEQVRALVQQIVEGDFDQIELYANKLGQLEMFIGQQTQERVAATPAAQVLEDKENALRVQQRYTMLLQGLLVPVAMPPYVREFLAQVWSQALVTAVRQDGAASERAQRYRVAARELVMSVQPKGSPALRKKFLLQLPGLMRDLHDGLALVGWPEAAKKDFFGKLLPAHAESLKGAAMTELDYNMLSKQVETIFAHPVPGTAALTAGDVVDEEHAEEIEQRFSPEESRQVGLVTESAVDWDGTVDLDLGRADPAAAAEEAEVEDADTNPAPLGLDINLDLASTEPAEPTKGLGLFDHIKLGFAYQMHLKDQWQKVRLTYVSPARSFFVFSHGQRHQETISMTARMLSRMCETGRMRAVESAYLLERATHRARRQLAALKTAPAPLN